jgi:hypothetical protein
MVRSESNNTLRVSLLVALSVAVVALLALTREIQVEAATDSESELFMKFDSPLTFSEVGTHILNFRMRKSRNREFQAEREFRAKMAAARKRVAAAKALGKDPLLARVPLLDLLAHLSSLIKRLRRMKPSVKR